MAMSMPIFVLSALNTENTTKRLNETMYIVRRPSFSEKDDLFVVSSNTRAEKKVERCSPPKWEDGHGKHVESHSQIHDSLTGVKVPGNVTQGSYSTSA